MKNNAIRSNSVSETGPSRLPPQLRALDGGALKPASDLHLARKAWHFLTGLMMATLYSHWLSKEVSLVFLGSALFLTLVFETARLRVSGINQLAIRFWGPIMRRNEVNTWSGTVHYLASALLAIAIFPKPIALLSILYLACGDPMASVVGILYGDRGPRFSNGKSLLGSLGGVIVCVLLTWVFLSAYPISWPMIAAMGLLGGVAGGLAELLPLDVNDNLSIPLVSGFTLWLGFIVLGI